MENEIDINLPCLICSDDVASPAGEAGSGSVMPVTVKNSKPNDDTIFQCFLKLFKVADFDGRSNGASCNIEDKDSFRFCTTCKTHLGKLLELQIKVDELKRQISIGTNHLKREMEKSEETFESEEIYECYPIYKRVRSKIVGKDKNINIIKLKISENENMKGLTDEPVAMDTNQQNLLLESNPQLEQSDWSPSLPPDFEEPDSSDDETEKRQPRKHRKFREYPEKKLLTYEHFKFQLLEPLETTNGRQVKCTLCDLIIGYKKEWIRHHVFKVHTDKYLCPHCPWKFPTGTRLRFHIRSVHEGHRKIRRVINCKICGRPISNNMKNHEWSHKSKEEKEEILKDPALAAEIPKSVRYSMERKYQCDKCVNKYSCLSELKKHQDSKHKDPEERKQLCPECGKSVLHLRTHMRLMHRKDDGVVDLMKTCLEAGCGKRFLNLGDLTRHKNQVHRKLKPFKCTQCGKCFGDKYSLKHHVKAMHGK